MEYPKPYLMRKSLTILFLFSTFCFGRAQEKVDLRQVIPSDFSVRTGELGNGLTFYLKRNVHPDKRAEMRLVIKAGSLQETDKQRGLAHFVEHMAFNGSRNFKKNELINYLEITGSRFGPDLNAYTSFAETVYQLQIRTDSLYYISRGLLILEDWADGITFDPLEIEKEKGVIRSEWRSRLNAQSRLQEQYFPVIYKDSPYPQRLPIGDTATIRQATAKMLREYYHDWYRPDNMAIVVVGDIDLDWVEEQIYASFGKLADRGSTHKSKKAIIPIQKIRQGVIATDKETSFTQVDFYIRHPSPPKDKTAKGWRRQLIQNLVNGMINRRLISVQQQERPPFTFAGVGYGDDLGKNDSYYLSAFTSETKALDGFAAVWKEVVRAQQHGFIQAELDRQKKEILRGILQRAKEENTTQSAIWANLLAQNFSEDEPYPTPRQQLVWMNTLLPTIQLSDLKVEMKTWMPSTGRALVVSGPEKIKRFYPNLDPFWNLIDSIEKKQWPPYQESYSNQSWLDKPLAAAPITKENYLPDFNITELYLPNGVQVVLKPTTNKNDQILLSAAREGGHSLATDEDFPSASNAIALATQSKLGPFSFDQLQKKLTGKTLSLNPYIDELSEGFSGTCAPEELEDLLSLIYLYCTQSNCDSTTFNSYRSRQVAIMQNMMTNPYYSFAESKLQIKYQNHPRRHIFNLEDLDKIDLQKAKAFFQNRFGNANEFTFVLVGAFESDSIKTLLAQYLGNLPTTGREETYRDIKANLIKGHIDSTMTGGRAPKTIVEINYHGDYKNTSQLRFDYSALVGVLRIKLREAMREDKGGVYGVNVGGGLEFHPKDQFRITLTFDTDPEKADTLIKTALEVIHDLRTSGPDEATVQKIKEAQWQSRLKNEDDNSFWLGQLATRYREGWTLDGLKKEVYRNLIDNLDTKSIQRAAQVFLNPTNFIQLVLKPDKQ
jgi:zinc protease